MPWLVGLLIVGGLVYAVRAAAEHAKNEPALPVPKFRPGAAVLVSTPATQLVPSLVSPGTIAAVRFDGPAGTVTYDVDLVSGIQLPSVPESSITLAPKPANA